MQEARTGRNRATPEAAKEFAQQSVLVLGFLGAIALTVLVLILQNPSKFEPRRTLAGLPFSAPHIFFAGLVDLIAMVSILSIVGSVSMMFVGSGILRRITPLYLVGFVCTALATIGIVFVIPLLLFSYTPASTSIILDLGILLLAAFAGLLIYSMRPYKNDGDGRRKADQGVDDEDGKHSGDSRPMLEGL